jgi:hypothetical protein
MNRMLKVLTGFLVIAVFGGIAANFASVFPPPDIRPADLSSLLKKGIFFIFPDSGFWHTRKQDEPVAERDRRLELNPEMISQLRRMYGGTINEPRVQAQVIEDLQHYLISYYPETWQERMGEALRKVFPDKAEQLVGMFSKLKDYNLWVDENWGRLLAMKRQERNAILWAKRDEIFGAESQDIWRGDLKVDAVYNVLEALNKVNRSPLEEKLEFLVATVQQTYGAEAEEFMRVHQRDILDGFLGLESVQADLKAMQPQEARQSLRNVRKAFGMSEAELARWEALDKLRDERWDKGLAYMKERQRVMNSAPGEDKALMLDELRKKYFGQEAVIIANEEAADFFRFGVKRIYGKN